MLDPTLIKGPFTEREDALLRKLVERDGPGNWAEKSQWFHGRTDNNLMSRWKKRDITGATDQHINDYIPSFFPIHF